MFSLGTLGVGPGRGGHATGWPVMALLWLPFLIPLGGAAEDARPVVPALRQLTRQEAEGWAWQQAARERVTALLLGGRRPEPAPLRPLRLRSIEIVQGGYWLEELDLQTLPDRTVHAWVAVPREARLPVGAVLVLHGDGGSGEDVVRGEGPCGYGKTLAEMGYVVIAPDLGPHRLQDADWRLTGERVWDAIGCVDYLLTRPEVDPRRIAVIGSSRGGETAMCVAALDERIRLTVIGGCLTTALSLKQSQPLSGDSPEPGLDLADLAACIAPRPLVYELGGLDRPPDGCPVEVARDAFARIQRAYRVFKAESNAILTPHQGGPSAVGTDTWDAVRRELGVAPPWRAGPKPDRAELVRRGEIARRCFSRALDAVEACWETRDAVTGLLPQGRGHSVWAPDRNGADLLPSLALACYHLAPLRLEGVIDLIPLERRLTTRFQGLPDVLEIPGRTFVESDPDPQRMIRGAAQYCWRGLLPMTEALGRGLWFDRMCELVEAIFAQAPVRSDYGPLPADDAATNGALLQVLSRLHWLTRAPRWLDRAQRIGDAYCLEVLPRNASLPSARWDFAAHRAMAAGHGRAVDWTALVAGLNELALATEVAAPRKAEVYVASLEALGRRLEPMLGPAAGSGARRFAAAAEPGKAVSSASVGSAELASVVTMNAGLGREPGRSAAKAALRRLAGSDSQAGADAHALADSVHAALLLLNRFPDRDGFQWVERVLPRFLALMGSGGRGAGEDGGGACARAALVAGLSFTQGFRAEPWTPRLRFGAAQDGGTVHLVVESDESWQGRLVPDRPRHEVFMNLPSNYPRSGELPEWFTVSDRALYSVAIDGRAAELRTGAKLREGIFVDLNSQTSVRLELKLVRP